MQEKLPNEVPPSNDDDVNIQLQIQRSRQTTRAIDHAFAQEDHKETSSIVTVIEEQRGNVRGSEMCEDEQMRKQEPFLEPADTIVEPCELR